MITKAAIRALLWRCGIDVIAFHPLSHPLARRRKLMESQGIDLVFDVGANRGQYGQQLRRLGYRGRIISFEPLSLVFTDLDAVASEDRSWRALNYALGDAPTTARLNVARNTMSSSFLPILGAHVASAPEAAYVNQEEVEIRTLDSTFAELRGTARAVMLKVDAQGYERNVLKGARNSLPQIAMVQLELSLSPMYEGEASLAELVEQLEGDGYRVVSIEPGFADRASGRLLQVDVIFERTLP